MAKFYSAAGTRRGKVGNEVYYVHKTQNIVKTKPDFVSNPKTPEQMSHRIRIKTVSLGYRNVNNGLKLDTFADMKPTESPQNAFNRHNISNGLLLKKETTKIKNFIYLSSDILCSFGTLDALNVVRDTVLNSIGLKINSHEDPLETIADLSVNLLDTYAFLRNGDYITLYSYASEGIVFNNQSMFSFDNDLHQIKSSPIRKCFKIDTQNQTELTTLGVFSDSVEDYGLLTIGNQETTLQCRYDYVYPSYLICFYAREIAEDSYNFSPSAFISNACYSNMCEFAKKEKYIREVLESWGTNFDKD